MIDAGIPRATDERHWMVRSQKLLASGAALEDRPSGEQLTDTILKRPDVEAVLVEIRRKPADRPQVLRRFGWDAAELFGG